MCGDRDVCRFLKKERNTMTAQRESSWYNRRSTKYNYHTMTMAHASALITRLDDAAGSAIPRTSGCPSRRSDHTAVCWTKGINDRAINESKRMTSTREMAAFHGSLLYSTLYRVNICAETHRFDEPRPWKGSPYRLLTALRRPLEIYTHVYIYSSRNVIHWSSAKTTSHLANKLK